MYLPLQFVVLKFLPTKSDDNEYFEVGLADWLDDDLSDDMKTFSKWPPANKPATNLVKLQTKADPSWKRHEVKVMRFYGKIHLSLLQFFHY